MPRYLKYILIIVALLNGKMSLNVIAKRKGYEYDRKSTKCSYLFSHPIFNSIFM
ncbi:hypothetical protein Javan477_0011 [Streptococcus phage Javan477]|nr:hypothetical protein Javan477_0011 [Streptococcus phage Javan477]